MNPDPVTPRRLHRLLWGLLAVLTALSVAGGIALRMAPRAQAWEVGEGPRFKTVFSGESTFNGQIRVTEDQFTRYLMFGNSLQTGQDMKTPARSALRYVDGFHLGMAAVPGATSALFIGLGGGMGPRQFHDFYPKMRIETVEIDPMVARIARDYFKLPDDARLKSNVGDGRAFLEKSKAKYDLILLDAYDAHSAPPMLTTVEFMRLVKSRLTDRGALVANVIAAREGSRSGFGRSEYKTMKAVFPDVAVFGIQSALEPDAVPSDYENMTYVALKSGKLPTLPVWKARVAKLRRPEIRELTRVVEHGPFKTWPTGDVSVLTDANPPHEELFGN